jgi:CHASE1-domain containing sensor protein
LQKAKKENKLMDLISTLSRLRVTHLSRSQGIALTALLYLIFGQLGLLVAVQPGNASAIWPPAGIALALMLLSDSLWWPGIFLGSFILNSYGVHIWESSYSELLTNELTAFGMASGATLQPVIGTALSRKILDGDLSMTNPHKTLRFMLIAGFICCLISSTCAIFSLSIIRGIALDNLFFAWFNWYVGDTIGVLIFAPFTLSLLSNNIGERLEKLWKVGIPCLFILGITSLCFYYAQEWEFHRLQLQFEKTASEMSLLLEKEMEANNQIVISVERFFSSDEEVIRSEFKSFTSNFLVSNSKIQSLAWTPLVFKKERAEFEQKIRDEGFPDFEITDKDDQNQRFRAGSREYYLPITYLESLSKNKNILGFDLASRDDRKQAMDLAGILQKPYASDPLYLISDLSKSRLALLLFYPVYKQIDPSNIALKKQIKGYVVAGFYIDQLIDVVWKDWKPEWMKVSINDISNDGQEKFVYGIPKNDLFAQTKKGIQPLKQAVPVSGKTWEITYAPNDGFNVFSRTWQTWSVLAAGLFLTGLVGIFLNIEYAHAETIQKINQDLGNQLSVLQKSQKAFFDHVSDGILLVDGQGQIILASESIKNIFVSIGKNQAISNINDFMPNWTKLRLKDSAEHLTEINFSSGSSLNVECKISRIDGLNEINYLVLIKPTIKKVAIGAHLPHFH